MPRVAVPCTMVKQTSYGEYLSVERPVHSWFWLMNDHDECLNCGKRKYVNFYVQIFRKWKNRQRAS